MNFSLVSSSEMTSTQLAMLVVAVIGLTILMLSTRKKMIDRARKNSAQPRARDLAKSLEREAHLRRDLDQVMIELDQLSRQIHARIDTKFAKLEAVIRDADERIAKLSQHAARVTVEPKSAGLNMTVSDSATSDLAAPVAGDMGLGGKAASGTAVDQRSGEPYGAIYALEDAGLTVQQIAEKIGKHAGEVQLILSLRKAHSGSRFEGHA